MRHRRIAFTFIALFALPAMAARPALADPQADAGDNQNVPELSQVVLNGSGSRADGDGTGILSYAWEQITGPTVVLSDPSSPTPSFTAPEVQSDIVLRFRLTVSDGEGSDTDATAVRVRDSVSPENRPPNAAIAPVGAVTSGSPVRLDGTGSSDPDGEPLAFAWAQTGGPPVQLQGADQAVATFVAPQTALIPVPLTFSLTVTDPRGGSGSAGVSVIVVPGEPQNRAPVANAGDDQEVEAGGAVELTGAASSDPDGDALTFAWTQIDGPAVTLSDPSQPVVTFAAPPTGADLLFRLAVDDGRGGSDTDDVSVRVLVSSPVAPAADAGDDRRVSGGGLVTLDGTGSSDPAGGELSFSWRQIGGPVVELNDADSAVATFAAPVVPEETELRFQLTVTSPSGQDTDAVSIVILAPDAPPPQQPLHTASIDDLSIFPNPFDPSDAPVTIEYRLGADSDVEITIYDMFGRLVRKLSAPRGGDGGLRGMSRWRWDGRNGEGDEVGNGGYLVDVRATDGLGNDARTSGRVAVVK